jgi:prepilin peptidase CpaA
VLEVLADFVLLIVILICLVTDLRERRIYNKIVFPAVAAGIILNTAQFGLPGLRTSITGLLIGVMLFIVPFALGGLGAGDVKLLGAVGALKGPPFRSLCGTGHSLVRWCARCPRPYLAEPVIHPPAAPGTRAGCLGRGWGG